MAQADYVPNAIRALITGASAKLSTNPVRASHFEFVAALAGYPPWPIPIDADATDLVLDRTAGGQSENAIEWLIRDDDIARCP
jgi:hypothetical protein